MLNGLLTPDDLKRGELIPAGWHPAEFTEYEEKAAATDQSTNIILSFRVIDEPGKGSIVNRLFNEKALGFGKALWKMWNFPIDEQGNQRITDDLIKAKLNSKLMIYTQIGKSNKGNEFNDLKDFRPMPTA